MNSPDDNLVKHVLALCAEVQARIEESQRRRSNARGQTPGNVQGRLDSTRINEAIAAARLPKPPAGFATKLRNPSEAVSDQIS